MSEFRIKEICKAKGITQKELAERIGISAVGLAKALAGNTTIGTLDKIAKALEVEVWELFTPSTSSSEFMALIKDGGQFYHASSLFELNDIVKNLNESHS